MVWIVGKVLDAENNRWEFQGVFTEEKLAVGACRDERFFVGPMVLDQELPMESVVWPGAYYPVKGGAK